MVPSHELHHRQILSAHRAAVVSALSSRPLPSADSLDLFVPRTRSALSQHHAFSVGGPLLWNDLPHPSVTRF